MNLVTPRTKIRAEHHNSLVEEIRRITPIEGPLPPAQPSFRSPWQCSVVAGEVQGTWKVTLLAGFVNDAEAFIPYLEHGDARGWKKPIDFPTSLTHDGLCERSWRESIDPPYMPLTLADAQLILNDGKSKVYHAHVFLCALPISLVAGRVVPSLYRTFVGQLPTRSAYPYGLRELATITLTESLEDGTVTTSVNQREFSDLAAAPVEPVRLLPDYQPVEGSFGILGFGYADQFLQGSNIINDSLVNQINEALRNLQAGTSSVEFWSVGGSPDPSAVLSPFPQDWLIQFTSLGDQPDPKIPSPSSPSTSLESWT